jgi:TetR/AcrR family transcriptional regulator
MSFAAAARRKRRGDDPSPNPSPQEGGGLPKATRIQQKNRRAILEAALEVFSEFGFRAATVDRIAERAKLSKPNLLYYYPSKLAIYVAVLEDTLAEWLQPLRELDPAGDPIEEIGRYIDAKLEMSRTQPAASRLFANEILHGAPAIGDFLRGPMKALIDEKAKTIGEWVEEGRLAPVDPHHLIMMIWAVTQHYADFDVQVRAVLGNTRGAHPARLAGPEIATLFFEGLQPRQGRRAARTGKSRVIPASTSANRKVSA